MTWTFSSIVLLLLALCAPLALFWALLGLNTRNKGYRRRHSQQQPRKNGAGV